ncbi:glycerophosphodiester phosphodiesterase [Pseudoduganella sp. FT55W]|uniref:Glycerophosphodiester phosphodiesterase n=1 Tax=Duganella rivi TaxID=2666083 RepID=A0A7X4GUT2_9BURK|nr:glycerophosphodiester phosphodiesterase family protein [Duganella rivi]MYM69017.1 glycerophosphodiester phosphodiesterase [Duganella rivi]
MNLKHSYMLLALLAGLAASAAACHAATRADLIRKKFDNPAAGVFVVAHRGCHNASPAQGLGEAPENSRLALEQCVLLGVDMMELDVRRAADGALVVMHDDTIDRTTNGSGRLDQFTLAQLKTLRLKQNLGAAMSPILTAETVQTLEEMLALAKGRIMLNLDIKEAIYPAVIAAVKAQGMERHVLVKSVVTGGAPPAADQPGFDTVPYMPIVGNWAGAPLVASPAEISRSELAARHKPAGVEMVYLSSDDYAQLRKTTAAAKVRLWANTLTSVGVISVIGMGGDLDGLRTQGQAWGALLASGVDTIQTDEPGPLLDYLERARIPHWAGQQ